MHSMPSKRYFARRRHGEITLISREPSLVDLPVALPSIPLLNPLVSALIGDSKAGATSSSNPSPPAPTPSSGGGGSGGSSSSSSSSSSSGDGTSGSDRGSGAGSTSSSNTSGEVPGSGKEPDGESSSGGNSVGGAGSSGGGSSSSENSSTSKKPSESTSTVITSDSAKASPGVSASAAVVPSTGTTPSTSGTSAVASSPTNGASTIASEETAASSSNVAAASPSPVSNVAIDNTGTNADSSIGDAGSSIIGSGATPVGTASGSAFPSMGTDRVPIGSTSTGNGSGSSSGSGNDAQSNAAVSHGRGLSGGAIGGIIVAVLALLALLIIFVFRRRSRDRRQERRLRWFASYSRGNYADNTAVSQCARLSQRSSFGTPFEGSLYQDEATLFPPTFDVSPTMPPMAQINARRACLPPIVSVTVETAPADVRASVFSVGSATSSSTFGSDSGQVLSLPEAAHSSDMPSTPMSVRPFSPSESFAFPKPPTSGGTTPAVAKADIDPFADPVSRSGSPSSQTFGGHAIPANIPLGLLDTPITPTVLAHPIQPSPSPSPSPSRPGTGSSTGTSSITIGTRATIARPFVPTLHDELPVFSGEAVFVIQAFDDGWAQVRNSSKGVGLIPIDCFREKGEDIPAFLASKRVSSFFQNGTLL